MIHRIDGPMRLYNDLTDKRDLIVNTINQYFADGSVFQSEWSKLHNGRMGLKIKPFNTVIKNAPDGKIFNAENRIPFSMDRKIRLVCASWSHNWKKGFEVYQWLDRNLNYSKYELTFIGNSPVRFSNIRQIGPLSSQALSDEFKRNDIFITASQKDPCSNVLIEAMHCGLPCVALRDGGHPEIIANGGELFETADQIPYLLEKICNDYASYQGRIELETMEEVWGQYFAFMECIYDKMQQREYSPKRITIAGAVKLLSVLLWSRVYPVFRNRTEKLTGLRETTQRP
ncbi:MAG: glycosyltransferase [Proteobacteria bacterium]|nr:glycosyltransferase [Pseudomonadota bacterium]